MSAEQVVRDFLSTFEMQGVEAAIPYLADSLTVRIVTPPLEDGKDLFIAQGNLLKEALPDYRWGVQSMTTQGNQVTVLLRWTGTLTGVFHLGAFVEGVPDLPPNGKKIAIADKFIFTVGGDQLTGVVIDSPADGGLVGMLKELGVQLPM